MPGFCKLYEKIGQKGWGVYILLSLALGSCEKGDDYPYTGDIEVDIKITRVDQEMACDDSTACSERITTVLRQHPFFSEVYLQRIIPVAPGTDSSHMIGQSAVFFSDSTVQSLRQQVLEVFPDNEFLQSSLRPVLQNWKYYFPDKPVPEFYSFFSLFNYGVVLLDDDVMGLGLDFFLGHNYPFYPVSRFPDYIQRTMDKKYLPSRVARGMIQNITPPPASDRLLDHMIYQGKILFLTRRFLPEVPDSLIFHYSKEKIEWMKDNELETWAALLREEMLYSRDEVKYRKLVSPSPSGPSFMPRESPGEAGSWIGWQIIKAYMARHPETSLQELVELSNSQKILDQSRYKPRN
jgi:hypothetical protein